MFRNPIARLTVRLFVVLSCSFLSNFGITRTALSGSLEVGIESAATVERRPL